MGKLYVGASAPSKVYVGANEVKRIYVGSELVYPASMRASALSVGDKVKVPNSVMGDTVFIVADKNHSGYPLNSVTLITEKVILHRAFDAKEPDNPNADRAMYGNNKYSVSNVDLYLNSNANSGQWYSPQHEYDHTPGIAPSTDYVTRCAYGGDAGFLYGFPSTFRNVLLDTDIIVALNTVIDGGGSETITRKMFLASRAETFGTAENNIMEGSLLALFSANTNASRIAYTSQYASDDNTAKGGSAIAAGTAYFWWLRTTLSSNSFSIRGVVSGGSLGNNTAYNGSSGIRPLCNIPDSTYVSQDVDADGCHSLIL